MAAPLKRLPIPSPNYSSRGGAAVRLIVLHTAEGARSIEELGAYFASSASGVSSHVGIDDTPGTIAEYVKRSGKAWTQGDANPVAVSAELCAFAEWDRAEWERHPAMLENAARWIAEEAAYFSLPLVELSPAEAQASDRFGVCQHADLGSWGGGHWDCGGAFPITTVLEMARGEETDEMGYPEWFWDWSNWYLTTDRDPEHRPDAAPDLIPEWAWEGLQEIERVGVRYGMTADERSWIDWYLAGRDGVRPDVPETIPHRWWADERWAFAR